MDYYPSPYELGGSPDIDAEDEVLAANDINPRHGTVELVSLEDADPIDPSVPRSVRGFSLTAVESETFRRPL
jgi:hypothetical protein